jgi:hypothetical protein
MYWSCATVGCSATVVTEHFNVVSMRRVEHNHGSDFVGLVNCKIKEECNRLITQTPYMSSVKIFKIAKNNIINEYNWSEEIFSNIFIFEEL